MSSEAYRQDHTYSDVQVAPTGFKKATVGAIPSNWKALRLEDLASVERGRFSPRPRNDPKFYNGAYPFIQTGDVTRSNGFISNHRQTLNEDGLQVSKLFPANVILITIAANIGDTAITTYPVCCPDSVVGIEPLDGVEVGWLRESIVLKKGQLNQEATQNAQKNINLQNLKPLLIATPPLPEQKKIAEILGNVDKAIAATEAVIEQTKRVKQGLLTDLLTKGIGHTRFKQTEIGEIPESWEVISLENLLRQLIDYRGKPPPKSNSGVPLITAKNVRMGFLNPEPREFIDFESFDRWMVRGIPSPGDIIFTTEAPLANVAEIPNYKIALGQRTVTLCPKPDVVSQKFLKWLLMSPQSQLLIASHGTGSTVKGIKQKTLRKLQFPIPPILEQEKMVAPLESLQNQILKCEEELDHYRTLKRGVMADLLTGHKRVSV